MYRRDWWSQTTLNYVSSPTEKSMLNYRCDFKFLLRPVWGLHWQSSSTFLIKTEHQGEHRSLRARQYRQAVRQDGFQGEHTASHSSLWIFFLFFSFHSFLLWRKKISAAITVSPLCPEQRAYHVWCAKEQDIGFVWIPHLLITFAIPASFRQTQSLWIYTNTSLFRHVIISKTFFPP